jgi:DNA-binding CsgD family transcriptional regulator
MMGAGDSPLPHLLEGLARITRAQIAIYISASGIRAGAMPEFLEVEDIGWANTTDRDRVYQYVKTTPLDADPLVASILESPGRLVTMARPDAMSTRDWALSEVRNDVHRPSGIDEALLSVHREAPEGRARVIVLKRAWGEPPFAGEERELVDIVQLEWTWLFGPSATRAEVAGEWSRREQETLDLLLTGASEKLIAHKLGLSPHTVHDYVKIIYRKAGVASRAELMARALASRPLRPTGTRS